MTRSSAAVLAGAAVLLVAILAVAVRDTLADPGPGGAAAELVPASALAYARLSTDPDDPEARELARLAPRIPGYLRVRDAALQAISPAPGAFDVRRDVRPWLGEEAAVALVELGGGRFGSLVLARVRDEPRAEALLQRVAGARPGTRYKGTVVRRFGSNAAAFVRGYLVAGPELAVQRSIDAAEDDAPALAESDVFERALAGAERPAQVYVAPRGLGAAPGGGVAGALVALLTPEAPARAGRRSRRRRGRPERERAQRRHRWQDGRRRRAGGRRARAGRARAGRGDRARRGAGGGGGRRGRRARRRRRGGRGRAEHAGGGGLARRRPRPAGAPARRLRRVARARATRPRSSRSPRARATPRACARCSPACRTRWPACSPRTRTRR